MPIAKNLGLVARLDEAIIVDPSGCWVWQAAQSNGYGYVRRDGQATTAHRAVWEQANGPLGSLHLHHLCANRLCVNPEHLVPITNRDHQWLESRRRCGSRIKDVFRLAEEGVPIRQIARTLTISRQSVQRILRRQGFTSPEAEELAHRLNLA